MCDNKTSQPAQEYDAKVEKTLPLYMFFHEHTLDLVKAAKPDPTVWLDTGCGSGNLVAKATKDFANTHFVLADPSEVMLSVAQEKFRNDKDVDVEFIKAGTQKLNHSNESLDVITAIMSHHYFDIAMRRKATENCFRMLQEGGVYVTFESIRPQSEKGLQIGLERWGQAQLRQGKTLQEVEKHISRYDVEFFPISIDSHLKLLKDSGFSTAEVFWVSVMQAGFYAIK